MRKVWYSYKHPIEVDPERLKLFEIGNILHDFILQVFKSEKNADSIEFLNSELPFKMDQKNFVISGRLDDVIVAKEDGKKTIIEVKSVKDVRSMESPNRHHVMQLQLYMHAIGIHDGVILYVDKMNLKTKSFEIHYDEKHSLDILKRFGSLDELLKKDVLPIDEARQSKETVWMCNMCEYRDKCDRNAK